MTSKRSLAIDAAAFEFFKLVNADAYSNVSWKADWRALRPSDKAEWRREVRLMIDAYERVMQEAPR